MKKVLFIAALVLLAPSIYATIINVPMDQPTIQAGIDAASSGDTVFVAVGTYVENVVIDKTISLIGEAENSTIIDGSNNGDVVLITANGVTIRNFSIENGGGFQYPAVDIDAGIEIKDADSCVIEFCNLEDNNAAGLALMASSYNTVAQCVVINNPVGIWFYGSDTGPFEENAENKIVNNKIWVNTSYGIKLDHWSYHHRSNLIRGNFLYYNGKGIYMITCEQNEVSHNQFLYNQNYAVDLSMCMCEGQYNEFHHNSFVSSGTNPSQASDNGEGIDYWYFQSDQEGNYWSDYTGEDNNSDGIGDTPYDIDGSDGSQDLYPLMEPEDADDDGIIDSVDNCPDVHNPSQGDSDCDFVGNMCDECTDYDGDGFGDPGHPENICALDNCPEVFNPAQEDFDSDGVGDSCDYLYSTYDDVWTDCIGLRVSNNGNFGKEGVGGHNLDYSWYGGECDPDAEVYLFDGTPLICYIDGADTIADYALFGKNSFHMMGSGNPTVPTESEPDYDIYRTGTFTTFDFTIGLEKIWWAPKGLDTCEFVIQVYKIYPFDGSQHEGISIGQGIDWDIPSDDGSKNTGGFDADHKLIYQRGIEIDGQGCQPNDTRFGGHALLGFYISDTCALNSGVQPHGAYTASNPDYLWPNHGFVPSELYIMMKDTGYSVCPDSIDQHTVMTFFADQTIGPNDTICIYSVLTTVRNGTLDDLLNNVEKARQWFNNHIRHACSCCDHRGNVDHIIGVGGPIDVSDLTYLVAYLFSTGSPPPCMEEGNIDGIVGVGGSIDVADLTYLVAYLFQSGPEPPPCP